MAGVLGGEWFDEPLSGPLPWQESGLDRMSRISRNALQRPAAGAWDDPAVRERMLALINNIGIPAATLSQRGADYIASVLSRRKLVPGQNSRGQQTMVADVTSTPEKVGTLHHSDAALRHAGISNIPSNLPIYYGNAGVTHDLGSRVAKDSMLPEWVAEGAANALSRRSKLRANPTQPGKIIAETSVGPTTYSAWLQPQMRGGQQIGWDLYKILAEGSGGMAPGILSKIGGQNAPSRLKFPARRYGPLLDETTGLPRNPVVDPQSLLDFANRRYRR